MKSVARRIPGWIQVAFWVAYTLFWHGIYSPDFFFLPSLLTSSIYTFVHVAIVYLNLEVLMPRFLWPGRYALYAASAFGVLLVSSVLLFGLLYAWFIGQLSDDLLTELLESGGLIGSILGGNTSMLFLSFGLQSILHRQEEQRQKEVVLREKMEAELQFLRSQLDPHFLFNALNSIYFLIPKDPDVAAEALAGFSDLLRYQLYQANEPTILLEEEFDYLRQYTRLASLRRESDLALQLELPPVPSETRIAPLLLQPFVENAFKHVSPREGAIKICAQLSDRTFQFQVVNTKLPDHRPVSTSHAVGGIGLHNVRRRLELIYPKRHELQLQAEPRRFSALLKIEL